MVKNADFDDEGMVTQPIKGLVKRFTSNKGGSIKLPATPLRIQLPADMLGK